MACAVRSTEVVINTEGRNNAWFCPALRLLAESVTTPIFYVRIGGPFGDWQAG
jgi:hypothetical protein